VSAEKQAEHFPVQISASAVDLIGQESIANTAGLRCRQAK
jgi:hypothetical protein